MAHPTEPAFDDRLLSSAARFMIDGLDEDAANVLLSCRLDTDHDIRRVHVDPDLYGSTSFEIRLYCPRVAYDILMDEDNPLGCAIRRALKAISPVDPPLARIHVRGEMVDIDPNWHSELLEIARGKEVSNQCADMFQSRVRTWKNLRFRSQCEVQTAAALDAAGVLFFPNCKGRLTTSGGRANREPDFLVCDQGKWGILEVDGEEFHPPTRTVQDHERDRLFKAHGIRVVEHFDASECFENARGVVERFLDILRRS